MATKVKDLYAVLGVERTATEKEIKSAHRKLAKTHHPDISEEENAQEIFEEIQTAYEVLMDSATRQEYDEDLKRSEENTNYSIKDIYAIFAKGKPGAHMPIKGEDVDLECDFTVPEVIQRATKVITFDRRETCSDCEGHGHKRDLRKVCHDCKGKGNLLKNVRTPFGELKKEVTCKRCNGNGYADPVECTTCEGKGYKEVPVQVPFKLPKDVKSGDKIILNGKGDGGKNGGLNGDLIVKMVHNPHDQFRFVNDYDIETDLNVSFLKCMTGGSASFKLPSGKVIDLPIQRGTQHGHKVMVPEQGMFNPNNGFYGLLSVVIHVEVPQHLPEEKLQKMINILG